MDEPLPVDDDEFLNLLHRIVSRFSEHETVPDSLSIDHAYVFGSRGEGLESKNSDLDILLSMTEDSGLPEDEFEEICEDLQSHFLWEHTDEVLQKSGLGLETSKENLDVVVYPDGVAQWELDQYMAHGQYQNAYSLTENEFLY